MKRQILFIGGTPRGLELIKLLITCNVRVVYAFILEEDDHEPFKVSDKIAGICKDNGILALQTKRITEDQCEQILAFHPDVAFVCGWRSLIPGPLVEGIPRGCLTAHDSLLPKYRGCAPTACAIRNGEKETGVTLFKIDDRGVDTGDIFAQEAIKIGEKETASDIYPRVVEVTINLYRDFLNAWEDNRIRYQRQDDDKATIAPRRTPKDGEICWEKTSFQGNF